MRAVRFGAKAAAALLRCRLGHIPQIEDPRAFLAAPDDAIAADRGDAK
jgi:hypothetical protein